MKQPHEDVQGLDLRHLGHLLCLGDEAQAHRSLIVSTAHLVLKACLAITPTPTQAEIDKRLRNPLIGDLVFEESTFWRSYRKGDPHEGNAWCKGFGFLIEDRVEWAGTDEEWEDELANGEHGHEQDDRPTDRAWYVQFGPEPDDVCRWVGGSFIAIPTDPHEHLTPGLDRGLPRLEFDEIAHGAVLPKEQPE